MLQLQVAAEVEQLKQDKIIILDLHQQLVKVETEQQPQLMPHQQFMLVVVVEFLIHQEDLDQEELVEVERELQDHQAVVQLELQDHVIPVVAEVHQEIQQLQEMVVAEL